MTLCVSMNGTCGNATLWDHSRAQVHARFPEGGSGGAGGRLIHGEKCCVATLVKSTFLAEDTWVVNLHLVHNRQGERIEQLKKVLGWLNDRVALTPRAVLLCGDFNVNYGTREYNRLRQMLGRDGYSRLDFDSTVRTGACPITFPSKQTSIDFAFVRDIGGTVTCFDNQRLSDHNGLRITLDGGLIVLCFNAHFGTDAHEEAQDAAAYARLIDTSGASVVCMQEIDATIGNRTTSTYGGTQADEMRRLLAAPGPWHSQYFGARPMNLPRKGKTCGYASKWGSQGGGGGGGAGAAGAT